MKRPSFQFYPGDWTSNPNLKRCTFAEKGIWLEVICLMHDQPEYGVLRWPLKEIAEAVKCRTADLQALIRKGVLKGDDKAVEEAFIYVPRSGRKDGEPVTLVGIQPGPMWYSSRMVKDEYVRTIRGESTRFGEGNDAASKHTPKAAPKPPFGDGASSSSSSSSSPSGESSHASPAGLVCKALRQVGFSSTNPSDPRLLALLAAGATLEEIVAVGEEAARTGKGWAWLLTVVQARRKDAAAIGKLPSKTTEAKPWDDAD